MSLNAATKETFTLYIALVSIASITKQQWRTNRLRPFLDKLASFSYSCSCINVNNIINGYLQTLCYIKSSQTIVTTRHKRNNSLRLILSNCRLNNLSRTFKLGIKHLALTFSYD